MPFFIVASRAQILDLNSNGMSDVWEIANDAQAIDPNEDSDGDGVPNRLEAIAGTNPFDARSVPRILPIMVTTNGVRVTMEGVLGKRYELQASEVVCGSMSTNWITERSTIARTNTMVVLIGPTDLPMKFFRMAVSDVDTDGDGLSDAEEYQLGLDPFSANSNGKTDAEGKALTDLAYANKWLAATMLKQQSPSSVVSQPGQEKLVIYPKSVPSGTGLTGNYFTNSSANYTNAANFNLANHFLTTNDSVINFTWGPANTPNLSNGFYTVRWTGQVSPQYSETYMFETRTDDGVKLWVNDQLLIDKWQVQGTTSWTNAITLQAGVRYNIRMEYFNRGNGARAQLYWYSLSQPRQIIPATQLYPESDGTLPGAITSPTNAIAFLGQPFTYTITAANSPLSFGATNLSPGLGLDTTNGTISGIPTLAGGFAAVIV